MIQTIPINLPESIVEQFCQRYHIKNLSLFGSILRDDFSPDSDIDCLVEFTPEHVPGLFSLSIMQDELSEIDFNVIWETVRQDLPPWI
jgi:uncharacterized protein